MIDVRRAIAADAKKIAAAELAYIDCPWSETQIGDEIANDRAIFLVAEINGTFCGYLSGVTAADECEISNIAVLEEYRRRGVATALFDALTTAAGTFGVKNVFLLVRSGNLPAITLYRKLGFAEIGVRKGYYKGQDAVIMRRIL